jgi:hypothetical protein
MRRWPTWLLAGALVALGAAAVADALRSTGGGGQSAETQSTPKPTLDDLEGLLLVADADCSVRVLRLPGLTQEEPPRRPDCRGAVWSDDATLVAECAGGVTSVHNANGELVRRLRGCSPAWREDGSVGVLNRGALVVARSVFPPVVLMTRTTLHANLAELLERAEDYDFVAFDWIGISRFAVVVRGGRLDEQALVVFTTDGENELIRTGLGRLVSSVRVSPRGTYLTLTNNNPERGFSVLTREGDRVLLPRVANARALAWSPDERWVALATSASIVVARTGSREVVARLPLGGESLSWLP